MTPARGASTYQYAKLPYTPDSLYIRVISILPGGLSNKVCCSLKTVKLEDAEKSFTALCYTWGSSLSTHVIKIEDAQLSIAENLHQALIRLRDLDLRITIWIDALCINQNDDVEKTSQVSSMGKIYESAARTIFWLEPKSPQGNFKLAKCFFNWLTPIFRARYPNARDPRGLYLNDPEPNSYVDVVKIIDAFNAEARQASEPLLSLQILKMFYKRSWFTHRWVLQEIHNASNVEVLCGAESMGWSLFQKAMDLPLDLGTSMPQTIANVHGRLDVSLIDILQNLESYDSFQCQDDRDRLSSLLNFRASKLLTDHYGSLTVDYNISVERNYIAFARTLIEQGRVLTLLLHASKRRVEATIVKNFQMPTWVPDWRIPPHSRAYALDCCGY